MRCSTHMAVAVAVASGVVGVRAQSVYTHVANILDSFGVEHSVSSRDGVNIISHASAWNTSVFCLTSTVLTSDTLYLSRVSTNTC